MKTIGILGGMSAASTQNYYSELCRLTLERFGGLQSPDLLIRSLNFAEIAELQAQGNWDEAGRILNAAALALEKGGADVIILATNTMHKLAADMMAGVSIPFVHIAETTAQAIVAQGGLSSPGLMATKFTMEQDFYTNTLRAHGLTPVIPNLDDRDETHRIIYDELCKHIVTEDSRATYVAIAERLVAQGADCLILGCTEVGLLLDQTNVSVPVFDTTQIHCLAAFETALSG